jgi:hypothetical protein
MNKNNSYMINRRGILKGSAAALGGAFLAGESADTRFCEG